MNINSWKISSMKRIRKRKEKFIIQATMENCFACRDTWPKSTVGKLSPSIQQTSSNRKVRTLVIYKPFINETSTIDFRLISDNRIDTKPRDGEGGEREKKERHEFHLCTRFRGPSNLFPAIAFETKQPLEKPPLIPVTTWRILPRD